MRFTLAALLTTAMCSPLFAQSEPSLAEIQARSLERAVMEHTVPAVERFDDAARDLVLASAADCTPAAMQPAYHAAFDAWMGLQHLHMGPVEENGRILAIAFWPDKKGMIPRTLARAIADEDAVVNDAEGFSDASIALRGLFALEYMLFDPQFDDYDAGSYSCALVQAISNDLGRMAHAIDMEWTEDGGFKDTLLLAGEAESPIYLSQMESVQALYTMLNSSLENTKDQRIGRPIGTFERPRPTRAEAYRSARSERNVILQLEAARDLAHKLAPGETPKTDDAFEQTLALAEALDDPDFSGAADPMRRLKIEIVGQNIDTILGHIANEVGASLGVSAGFNASDGD
ncbi:imelysin family protein [Celeribacter litoreus]|uniref:imelysin family protein n=1 Tax=Celeribacter litoreus TaxID=2876714 RepID=UPI001CCB42C1|nr:imelysin family protein [Celeribacter litoreus]MCA0043282.1 imelysin family protein [Celeribacter litoreus]